MELTVAELLVRVSIIAIVAIALGTLGFAVRHSRTALREALAPATYVVCAELALWPLAYARSSIVHLLVLGIAVVALLVTVRQLREAPEIGPGPSPTAVIVLPIALAAAFLLHDLGGYSGILVTWETPVSEGFADAFRSGLGFFDYFRRRLLWDDGLVSGGHTSLFYGVPTYGMFLAAGFSTWTLRFASVVGALVAIGAIGVLGRRFFSAEVGAAATWTLMLAPPTLFYGRYGTSLAGTVLAVLFALHATWAFLERGKWWRAAVCAVALYVATLQYSPARILVLLLLGWIVLVSLLEWRRLDRGRIAGIAIVLVSAALVWWAEDRFGASGLFLNARGEQFLEFVRHPHEIEGLFGRTVLPREAGGVLAPVGPLELAWRILGITIPQYVDRLAPVLSPAPSGSMIVMDPPPLPFYFAPLAPFLVWGAAVSIARSSERPHAFLLFWFVVGSLPILLTNRVDAHRLVVFVVPLSLWTAIGFVQAARRMKESGVPSSARAATAAALILATAAADVDLLRYHGGPPRPVLAKSLAEESESVPGSVLVVSPGDHRELSWLRLHLLDRLRRDPRGDFTLLPPHHAQALRGPNDPAARGRHLQGLPPGSTVLLAPATEFGGVARWLQRRGFRVARREREGVPILRADEGAAATGIGDDELRPLPPPPPLPTPPPLAEHLGPKVSLTAAGPLASDAGFGPARIDARWAGGPLVMGGVRYERGIGVHAWSKETYAVPPGAVGFEAVVGLDDDVSGCSQASVTFEVRNESDALLYDSGLVDPTVPPRKIHVPLGGARAIVLATTEAGDGRDCDHAIWANPVFLLP